MTQDTELLKQANAELTNPKRIETMIRLSHLAPGVLAISFAILSCSESRNSVYVPPSNDGEDVPTMDSSEVEIDFDDLTSYSAFDGFTTFNAPKKLFKRVDDGIYYSEALDAEIKIQRTETLQIDDPESIWHMSDFERHLKDNREFTYEVIKKDWIVLSGYTPNGNIYYLKGLYTAPTDIYFEEYGSNVQPFCFTATIEIIYPVEAKEAFDKLIPIITKSFKINLPH